MNKPQVVVFDLGKVLVDFDYGIAAKRFAARGRKTPQEIRDFIDHSPLLYRFETGLMSKEEFYAAICAESGFTGTQEEFSEIFADIFSPIDEMIAMQATLRQRGVPTYIFSNTNEIAVRWIKQRFPFFAHFTGYVYSYEHGAMKPHEKIYKVVEQMTGRSGQEIVYLDDRAENVAGGAARGWHAILHQDPRDSRARLQAFGLLG
jgi:HAD superfamily hydrolase (TIGR01509 family)